MYFFLIKFLILIIISLLILKKIYKFKITEFFQDSYISTKLIQSARHVILITEEHEIFDSSFIDIPNKVYHIKHTTNKDDANFILTNCYKFYSEKSNSEVVTITNMPNLCVFFCNNKKINSITNINKDSNKLTLIPELSQIMDNIIIGYSHDYEKKTIEYILYASEINILAKNISFVKVSSKNVNNALFVNNTIDVYFYCNTFNSPLLDVIIKNEYSILSYNNIKIELLKNFIPFCRRKNIILSKKLSESQLNSNIILIDNLIYKNKNDNITNEIDTIQNIYNSKTLNSYYSAFFNIHKKIEVIDDSIPIFSIENFESVNINLKLTIDNKDIHIEDVPNQDKNILKPLYYKIYTTVDDNNIAFMTNDKVDIISENNKDYNGKFYVSDVTKKYIIVSHYALFYDITIADTMHLSKTNSNIDKIKPENPLNLHNNDLIYIMGLNKEAIYIDNYINIINTSTIDYSSKYVCFEDSTITSQSICEGIKNFDGTTKDIYTWDRICVSNSECPYYLANKNYLNKRGGCISGYCELPLGIKRKSYRKYELSDTSFPLCKGCIDKSPKDCCKSQDKNSKYVTPNYVFPNENIEEIL